MTAYDMGHADLSSGSAAFHGGLIDHRLGGVVTWAEIVGISFPGLVSAGALIPPVQPSVSERQREVSTWGELVVVKSVGYLEGKG